MEYCGLKSSSVRAATMKKSGKARKSHSRRRCFGVADAGQNSSDCMRSPATRRCVVNYADNTKAEARRAKSRGRRVSPAQYIQTRALKGGAPEYCGVSSHNVKAATLKKSGKARKSHSRRRCSGTHDASRNSSDCMVSPSSQRCVLNYADNAKAEARRIKARSRRASRK